MHKELLARGIRVGRKRVRRLMQQHGIRAKTQHKFVVTTDSRHSPAGESASSEVVTLAPLSDDPATQPTEVSFRGQADYWPPVYDSVTSSSAGTGLGTRTSPR